jgi:hypothetical protein
VRTCGYSFETTAVFRAARYVAKLFCIISGIEQITLLGENDTASVEHRMVFASFRMPVTIGAIVKIMCASGST